MSLIQISHLSFRYDGGTEELFQDVSLNLDSGWHLGLLGRNGRGKTTFFTSAGGPVRISGDDQSFSGFFIFSWQAVRPPAWSTLPR